MIPFYGTGEVFFAARTHKSFRPHWTPRVRVTGSKMLGYVSLALIADIDISSVWEFTSGKSSDSTSIEFQFLHVL